MRACYPKIPHMIDFRVNVALRWGGLWLVALASPAFAQSDADLLAAKSAFERNDANKLAALAPKLDHHVLAPYVAYWKLKLALDDSTPEAVQAYLDRYPGTPLADRLRIEWLKSLAKRGQWARFAIDYPPPFSTEDVELACYAVQYRRQRDGDAALGAAKPLWFTGKSTPDACDPVFTALLSRGDLTTDDRLARIRLALEAGNLRTAKALATDLTGGSLVSDREFTEATREAQRTLAKGRFDWKSPSGRLLALAALERAARADAVAAHEAWVKVRGRLPEADRDYGNARLAYHAARQHLPAANDWFGEAGSAPLTDEMQEWRVRAALRAVAWRDVLAAIDAMPESQRQEATWRYWRARALAASGRKDEAAAVYASLALETSFYGILAAEAQGQRFVPLASVAKPPASDALAAFGSRAEVKRVVKLAELDMRPESLREWQYVIRGLDDDALLLAAEHARRVGLYDRAINTAERTASTQDLALRYLAPFRPAFDTAAKANDIDVALLYGIARQESRFIADIVSSAGAVGLMQLMPGTARWVAKQVGRGDYSPALIADAELNTQFGAFYFKYWFERLERMPALAAAAYNAGPGRAQAWRPQAPLEGAIWVETIPFNETRDYVKKVLANAYVYAHTFDKTPQSLTDSLGVVPPRGVPVASVAVAPPE